jgi:dTDP-4-dehydrorhamnose reductase
MRVAVVGARGQVGTDLCRAFADHLVIPLGRPDAEVGDLPRLRETLRQARPDVVLNTAAFHRVDDCEDDPAPAFMVNAVGAANLARACADIGALVVHFSTDYVFGRHPSSQPWPEDACPAPLNVYGVSKLAGEQAVQATTPRHLVVRTSGLFGVAGSAGKGGNFVETMLRLQSAGQPIRVVDDQVLGPTYTHDLADRVRLLVEREATGIVHVTSSGACSWYEFAAEIFRQSGRPADLSPQTTRASGARAARPPYSVLAHDRLARLGLPPMPAWQDALARYLADKGHLGSNRPGAGAQ